MTLVAKGLLFLSSYAPLFALLLVRTTEDGGSASVVFAALTVVGVAGLLVALRAVATRQPRDVTITAVDRPSDQVAAYTATYLLPFITVTFVHWQDWAVFAGFLIFIGFIYVQSDLIYLNPLMALCKWRMFQVRYTTAGAAASAEDRAMVLISRHDRLHVGTDIAMSSFGADIGLHIE